MNWPLRTLDEIFEIARGGSPRPIDQFITDADDGVNWIMIGDASNSSKHIRETKKKIKPSGVSRSRLVKPGDFLLTNSMSFGRPYILDTHGCIHDGWLVLSPRRANVDHDYFYHLLGSPAIFGQFEKLAAGATVKNLNIDLVKRVIVALPPLEEQKRIAAILDQADELRRKRQRALDRLNQLGQAIFIDMFGDGASFESASLRTLGRVSTGSTPPTSDADSFGGPVPFVTPGDLGSGEAVKRSLTEAGAQKSRLVGPGATLVCCIGATIGKMGQARERSAFNQQINAVDWGDRIGAAFGFFAVQQIRSLIIHKGKGASTTLPILKKSEFEKLEIFVPPMVEQQEFAHRVGIVQCSLTDASLHNSRLEELFASLQHRAFRGEL
ncbi:type I restriction-modification system, S subunit [Hyphomonas neptunium ATCC 15444]|uniref:Type I restriction-modification system, S subunit n=2 Tax=Hyphomonas TaxID=85 RepID=Q0BZ59_HYPNA|nr:MULTISPECIES: restriction endonuclease subunit S [Hyphomonas]ABI76570.1 type I restriction-modification system, S subunit [Hyphomonas neptunium ATCC 15444]KCZ95326.1 type I restriction-modification system subunit S [Hyphomonas hirschiana VP5]